MQSSEVLKVVGQVAGIGGLSLGVLLLIFREVIRKRIFPMLLAEQAYKLIRLVVICTFAVSLAGIAAWVYTSRPQTEDPVAFPTYSPEPEIQRYLTFIDSGDFRQAWDVMANEAHRRFQFDAIAQTYRNQRTPLGTVANRRFVGTSSIQQLPDQTRGAFNLVTFHTTFSNGQQWVEGVTVIAEQGRWRVLFHQLAPCTPAVCASAPQ